MTTKDVTLRISAEDADAEKTIEELGKAFDNLTKSSGLLGKVFGQSGQDVDKLTKRLTSLEGLTNRIAKQNTLIDSFRKQGKEALELRRQWQGLQKAASEAAQKMRVGDATQRDVNKLAKAASRASTAYERKREAVRRTRAELVGAGVDISKLSTRQNQLNGYMRTAQAEINKTRGSLVRSNRQLNETGNAARKAGTGLSRAANQTKRLRREASQLPSLLKRIGGLLIAAFSAREIALATESYTTIRNRLTLVTESSEELAAAQDDVFRIAQNSRQPLLATAELYQRIATNADDLEISGAGVAGVIDTINKTLAISNTTGPAASAAITQLSQAFGSGVLRGEELNSVLEQAPALAKALADGLGVSVGELRELGKSGQLTAKNVIEALESQADAVDAQFGKIQATGKQAVTVLGNSLTRLIGELNETTGASAAFADIVLELSEFLDSGTLTDGLVESLAIWSGVFRSMAADVNDLGGDLEGLEYAGGETVAFLIKAFKELPANIRASIQIATVEVLALFDKIMALRTAHDELIKSLFTNRTTDDVVRDLENKFASINDARQQGIQDIIDERDAILSAADAESDRREKERRDREEARAARQKEIAQLREQAKATRPIVGEGGTEQSEKDAKKRAERLAKIQDEIAEKEADTLTRRLELVRREYQTFIDELQAAGDANGVSVVEKLIGINQEAEIKKFVSETVSSIESDISKLQTENADERVSIIRKMYQDLMDQLQGIAPQSLIDSTTEQRDAAILADMQNQINQTMERRANILNSINVQMEAGLITQAEGQQRIKDFNAEVLPGLNEMVKQAIAFAQALGDENMVASLQAMKAELSDVRKTVVVTGEQVNMEFANGFVGAFESFVDGTQSAKDAFRQFASDFLKYIARMILQQTILNALGGGSGGGGGFGAAIANGINAAVKHEGGIVGGGTERSRRVVAGVFDYARRMHQGGIAGLKPGEVPAILEKGEEVLKRSDARHILNGGGQQQQGETKLNVNMINTIDSPSVVAAGLSSPVGTKTLFNFIRANKTEVKSILDN